MVSEEKIKILVDLAKYEKKYGKKDFMINKYSEKDYISYESIRMGVSVTVAFLGIVVILAVLQLDMVIQTLGDGTIFIPVLIAAIIYGVVLYFYYQYTRKRARKLYREVQARVKMYDKRLEDLQHYYEEKDKEDNSPSLDIEEKVDGDIINI